LNSRPLDPQAVPSTFLVVAGGPRLQHLSRSGAQSGAHTTLCNIRQRTQFVKEVLSARLSGAANAQRDLHDPTGRALPEGVAFALVNGVKVGFCTFRFALFRTALAVMPAIRRPKAGTELAGPDPTHRRGSGYGWHQPGCISNQDGRDGCRESVGIAEEEPEPLSPSPELMPTPSKRRS
jgi:hypothetical protein